MSVVINRQPLSVGVFDLPCFFGMSRGECELIVDLSESHLVSSCSFLRLRAEK